MKKKVVLTIACVLSAVFIVFAVTPYKTKAVKPLSKAIKLAGTTCSNYYNSNMSGEGNGVGYISAMIWLGAEIAMMPPNVQYEVTLETVQVSTYEWESRQCVTTH